MNVNPIPCTETGMPELLSRFSHEVRTPLTSIIGYAEVMLSDPNLTDEAKQEYMEIIRQSGRRLSDFLDAYIESEVAQRNRQLCDGQPEDVSLLIHRAMERVAAQAKAKSADVVCICDPAIFIDGVSTDHVVHIVENLLVNMIDLTPEGGHIDVKAEQHPLVTEIDVINKDKGFRNLSAHTARKSFRWVQSPGIEIHHEGLGLAFAKHVVELEGGLLNIQLLQQALTFTLQLPRSGND